MQCRVLPQESHLDVEMLMLHAFELRVCVRKSGIEP